MQKFKYKKKNVVHMLKFYNAIAVGYLTYNMSAFPFPCFGARTPVYCYILLGASRQESNFAFSLFFLGIFPSIAVYCTLSFPGPSLFCSSKGFHLVLRMESSG